MHSVFRVLGLTLVLLLFFSIQLGEAAAKKKPAVKAPPVPSMTFAIVRSSVVGCEPNCPEWISAEGQLTAASAGLFRKILKQASPSRLPVVITSQGGDVDAALAIGQMIRDRRLDVVVGWTLFTGCSPAAKTCRLPKEQHGVYSGVAMTMRGYCFSACPFILASGQKRMVGSGAYLGVHEISSQPVIQRIRYIETYQIVNGRKKIVSRTVVSRKNIIGKVTTKLSKPFDNKLRNYLNTMGVSLAMLDLLHLAPPSSIHNLTTDEMNSTRLVTDFGFATDLVANSLCKTTPPADNCKVEKNFAAALVPPPASAEAPISVLAYGSSMAFAIVRSNVAGCEPLCPEWIYADGKITPDTPALFKKILAKTGNGRLPVIIRSDGGDAVAAMAFGRMIRERKLDLAAGATLFTGCSTAQFFCRSPKDANGNYRGVSVNNFHYCHSACVIVLAAGQKRLVQYGDPVAVTKLNVDQGHATGKVSKVSTAATGKDGFLSALGIYFDEMGIDRELAEVIDRDSLLSRQTLSLGDLGRFKLMTDMLQSSSLTSNEVCKSSPPADNCIRR